MKHNGREWAREVIANRVSISHNANSLRVTIKAPEFSLGNNFLTLCLTLGVLGEAFILYLMVNSAINLALLAPGFALLGASLGFGFVKLWLWHNFGEELISIRGNTFEMYRNYSLFKSEVQKITLSREAELFTNRNDKWSWTEFRSKGILRLATPEAKQSDFGLSLNDQEYEAILRPIAEQLDHFKKQEEGIQFSHEAQAQQPVEEAAPLPNLEKQTEGQHKAALETYLDKAGGEAATEQVIPSKSGTEKAG